MVAPLLAVASVAVAPAPAAAVVDPQTTKTETLKATFKTENQSLWGPGDAEAPRRQSVSFFDESWDASASGGGVTTVYIPDWVPFVGGDEVGDFGVDGSVNSDGQIGMSLALEGMDGGKVAVDYPVKVDVTMPGDKTFGAGDTIKIATSVAEVQDGAAIRTVEPYFDRVALAGAFGLRAGFGFRICFFSCTGYGPENLIDIDDVSGEIFSKSINALTGGTGRYCFGDAEAKLFGLEPYSSPTPCAGNVGYVARPNPQVATTTNPDGTLSASGEDLFAVIPISAVTWLQRITGGVPLNGSKSLGAANLTWEALQLKLNTEVSRLEELTFAPKVNVTLAFPRAVSFEVLDPGGTVVSAGSGTSVTLRSGNTVAVKVPTDQTEPFTATPQLSLAQSTLSNKVTHVVSGSGDLNILSASLSTPSASVAGVTVWSGSSNSFGPAYPHHFGLASNSITVVPRSEWRLAGFNSPVLSPLTLVPAPPPVVTPVQFDAVEGAPMTATVATFTDEVTKAVPDDYVATIKWGDGTPATVGKITASGGSYTITGTHTYEQYRSYPIEVDLKTVPTGQLATNHVVTDTTAIVSDAALTGTGATNNTTASGQPVLTWSNPSPEAPGDIVATFEDANPFGLLSDLSATIDWGDGTPVTTGIVTGPAPSNPVGGPVTFTVAGAHDYTELGLHTVTVTMTSKGGSTATTTTTTLSYTNPERGTFMLGGKKATGAVTYWGAQWMKANALTASASSSFKGFANRTAPACGTRWTAAPAPGNSSVPPSSVPTYMAVAVTNGVDQSGRTASGNTDAVVIVRTNPGYGAEPGMTGTGTVVAVLCGKVG